MKETVFDVLMYLFNNYLDDDYELNTDQDSLRKVLMLAGFEENQVKKAFDWLESLSYQDLTKNDKKTPSSISHRIFNDHEMDKLGTDCRGLITYLEQADILDSGDRELVIDRVMALESDEIDIYQLKWVVLMVLLNQPGKEAAFTWMEGVVMDQMETGFH
ncbi:MAG: Smg protein [Gammaproteobacteria bacterium]|jgi:Smg protein